MKTKLNVHFVQHTHWDREWYFTSDDSRTMLYYDMKYLIEYLEKHDDKFTFDGQSSIIDDFLKFSPEWKPRLMKVVKDKKLFVGSFYTQFDNLGPHGESILRNIEVGKKIAQDLGHSMQVGYLPDSFGHNNQTPQILRMNGLENFSFYRGLDPAQTNDQLYFTYKGLDGSEVLGHWQTHYSTSPGAYAYTPEAFDEHIVQDYTKPGQCSPSVKSYSKRNLGLPIGIPVGTDQRPFRKEVKSILEKLNKKYPEFNFIASDYETLLKKVAELVKRKKISLPLVQKELRQALTGRVHRSIMSSRMDIKQLHYKLETLLVNVLEPLSVMCHLNNIDVPWKMIEHVWKELFKSSAHDSYGGSNQDIVNAKLKQRLHNAIRTAQGIVAMLSRVFAFPLFDEKEDAYKKILLFNFDAKKYSGLYQFTTTLKKGHENGTFEIFDGTKKLKFSILKRNNVGAHERDALTLLINVVNVPAFSYKVLDIKYTSSSSYKINLSNQIQNDDLKIKVNSNGILISKENQNYDNLFKLAADPSVGDTYDHSPITFNDKKFIFDNYKILETSQENNTIKIQASANVPSGIDNWKKNKPSVVQTADLQLTLVGKKIHLKVLTQNKMLNGRLILLVDALSSQDKWKHDQQFGIYSRNLVNKYMQNWEKPNALGYKWKEFPTNLSPHQSFISNQDNTFTIFTQGTKEHEMIKFEGKNHFAITLFRAFGVFGRTDSVYRPGRASGARTAAPDCQMLDQKLEFDFILDINKRNTYEKFQGAKELQEKTYYIPSQWGLDRTILRWETNIPYYYSHKSRQTKFIVPKDIQNKQFVLSSVYKSPKGLFIARYLNVGNTAKVKSTCKISRTFTNF